MSRLKQSIAMLGGLTQYPKTYWITDVYSSAGGQRDMLGSGVRGS